MGKQTHTVSFHVVTTKLITVVREFTLDLEFGAGPPTAEQLEQAKQLAAEDGQTMNGTFYPWGNETDERGRPTQQHFSYTTRDVTVRRATEAAHDVTPVTDDHADTAVN